jgi:hypothetical protein
MERDQLVLYLLEHVTPLIRQYATCSALPFDDMYQDSSIEVLKLVDRQEQITGGLDGLRAMAYVRVRGALLNMLQRTRKRAMVSLDAPLSSENTYSLADLLPDPYAVEPPTVLLAKEYLEEMRPLIQRVKHNQTRRMCSSLQDSAYASLSY